MSHSTDNLVKQKPSPRRHLNPKDRLHFLTASNLLKRNRLRESLEHFQKSLKINPEMHIEILICLYKKLLSNYKNLELRVNIAEIYFSIGNYKEAVIELEEAFELDPSYLGIYNLLGKIYNKAGQKIKIRHIFESAVEYQIFQPEIIDTLSKIYLEEHNTQKGISLYKLLIKNNPENHNYFKILSELYSRNRDYDNSAASLEKLLDIAPYTAPELLETLTKLIKQAPRNTKTRKILIKVLLKICKPIEAVNHIIELTSMNPKDIPNSINTLKKALDQYPDTYEILFTLADLLIKVAEFSESVLYLEKIFKTMPDNSKNLIPLLESILDHYPNQYLALTLLADIFLKKQNYEKSLFYFDQLIELNQAESEAFQEKLETMQSIPNKNKDFATFLIAKIQFYKGNSNEALKLCDSLIETEERLSARLLQAKIYRKKHKYTQSFSILETALKTDPFHWEIHNSFKKTYFEMSNFSLEKIKNTASLYNDSNQQLFEIGLEYLCQGSFYKALEYFQKINNSPNLLFMTNLLLGRCFLEIGRFDLSINQFQKILNNSSDLEKEKINIIRYFIGINFLCLGEISHALHNFELVFENNMNFLEIPNILTKYKSESFLDLRGKAISGCLTFPNQTSSFSSFSIENPENKQFFSKDASWQTISFSHTHNNQGVQNILQNNLQSAAEEFKLAIQMDPKLTIAYSNLAYLYIIKNNFTKAKEILEKAKNINPKLDLIYLNYGLIAILEKNYDGALNYFNKSLKLNSKNNLTYLNIGDLYYQTKDLKNAFEYWHYANNTVNYFHIIQRRTRHLTFPAKESAYWFEVFDTNTDLIN